MDAHLDMGEMTTKALDLLFERCEKYRKVLEWYADEANYKERLTTDFDGEPIRIPIEHDVGHFARTALESN